MDQSFTIFQIRSHVLWDTGAKALGVYHKTGPTFLRFTIHAASEICWKWFPALMAARDVGQGHRVHGHKGPRT